MLLALTMVVGLGSQAFAAEIEAARVEAQVINEIEAEQAEVFAEVYAQLEAQGRLDHYDMYVGILAPKIEASIREERGLAVPYSALGVRAVSREEIARNGGVLLYTQTGLTSVVETYFDATDTIEYIVKPHAPKKAFWDFIEEFVAENNIDDFVDNAMDKILDGAGFTETQKTLVKAGYKTLLKTFIATERAPENIETCGYTVQMHEPTENTTSKIYLDWKHYPTVYVPTSNVKNVSWNAK